MHISKKVSRNFLFLLFLNVVCCSPSPRMVKVVENGYLLETYEIDGDSVRHGLTLKYFPSGEIFEKSKYVHGMLDGARLIYYPNGQLEIKENYCKGQFCDSLFTFFENGQKRFEAFYVNGEMTGNTRGYYESGELKEEVTFKGNLENGPFME